MNRAPPEFHDLQTFCNKVEAAERQYFVEYDLGVVAAIHQGKNRYAPSKDNPHVHILVTTRRIGPEGFDSKKGREPLLRLSLMDWQKECSGECTRTGDKNREIQERNRQRQQERTLLLELERELCVERSR